ncbi:hypothetical protein [Streptomyces sp. NPDC020747]|uniref:hypothetical protein n=1 Tax=Streptomyces sp. NPDC020747 TaxID=3365086 RepID=UPI0037A386F4
MNKVYTSQQFATLATEFGLSARASQPDDIRAWQWWSLHEMQEATQTIYPLGLADLITGYLRNGPPATPLELTG